MKMNEIITAFGSNPLDFDCVEMDVYRDVNNDQDYVRTREIVWVPKEIKEDVVYVNIGYEPWDVKFYNDKDEVILESAVPSTFQKHGKVTAFFGSHFGIK